MNDVRFALRQMAKAPGFTAVALLTLAVGIGACVAIFSVVNNVLLRPLPFPESDRVVVVRETFLPRLPEFSVASGKYFVWRQEARSFESLAAWGGGSFNLTGGQGEPVRLLAMRVTANMLSTFRVQPMLGRDFAPEEDAPGRETVAILSHGLWQRQFGGDPTVLGRSIQLDGRSFTVIGIMPRQSPVPERLEIITPVAFDQSARDNMGGHSTNVVGRLAPGVTVAQAQSELALLNERIGQRSPQAKGWGVLLKVALESVVGEVQPVLWVLLGAVGFLLLIACANVANLLLARATVRAREIAIRSAVGASRGRIIRQLLIESVLLGLMGGALGTLVAHGGLQALMALAPETLPRSGDIAVDGRALLFTCALAILTGVGFGLVPAFRAARLDLNRTLKESGRGTSDGGHQQRLRGLLVVGELALALVLLAGSGLLMRSFARLQQVDPGFQPQNALTATITLPRQKYQSEAQRWAFARDALQRLAALPGVSAVGAVQGLPFGGAQEHRNFVIAGRPPLAIADRPIANHYLVTPDYFQAMGIRLLRGRFVEPGDGPNAPRVALINESLAKKFFADEDPLGKRIQVSNVVDAFREIVGVVADIKTSSLDGEVTLQTYEPFAQRSERNLTFVLRAGSALALAPSVRATIRGIDPDLPIAALRPLADQVAGSIARQRFAMTLFAVFSGVALLLAAIGIYGVMAYSVAQRTGEIGIRMALGAQPGDLVGLVLRQGGRLVALGLAVGLGGALLLTRLLTTMLFGISPQDPVTFAAIAVLLALVAAAACLVPARRALRVDPMTALRAE